MPQSQPIIVVLVDEYHEYRKLAIDQIAEVAGEAGYGTLCVCGKELDPHKAHHQDYSVCNAIYNAVEKYDIAGVVAFALSAAAGSKRDNGKLDRFLKRYSHLPVVSLGIEVNSFSSVLLYDRDAMIAMMNHVLSIKPEGRVAYLQGTPHDPYSLERESLLIESLSKHNLDPAELLYVQGNYSAIDSYNHVIQLLEQHHDVSTIVAANDIMAESASRAVQAAGRSIPSDIIITGFDDTKEATQVSPALTTVRQPIRSAATLTARKLLDDIRIHALDGKGTTDKTTQVANGELIIRGSTASNLEQLTPALAQCKESIHARLSRALTGLEAPQQQSIDIISEALWQSINNDSNKLQICLDNLIANTRMSLQSSHWWSNVCHQLEIITNKVTAPDNEDAFRAKMSAATAKIRDEIWATRMNNEHEKRYLDSVRTNMQLQMSSCDKLEDILSSIQRWLDQTKIQRFFLIRYSTPGPVPAKNSQLVLAVSKGKSLPVCSAPFQTEKVLPQGLQQQLTSGLLILNPIYAGSNLFGYMLIDPTGFDHLFLDSAAQSIGNALRNQYLISRLEHQTSHLQKSNNELIKLANHDDLTGLSNRHSFNAYLDQCYQREITGADAVCLMFIDLDGFKSVNDRLGHEAGDMLLKEVAHRLRRCVNHHFGASGKIARLGGDEFTVLTPSAQNKESQEALAHTILGALSTPYSLDDQMARISASIGISSSEIHSDAPDNLIKLADDAMYKAKKRGKNRFVWAELAQDSVQCDWIDELETSQPSDLPQPSKLAILPIKDAPFSDLLKKSA